MTSLVRSSAPACSKKKIRLLECRIFQKDYDISYHWHQYSPKHVFTTVSNTLVSHTLASQFNFLWRISRQIYLPRDIARTLPAPVPVRPVLQFRPPPPGSLGVSVTWSHCAVLVYKTGVLVSLGKACGRRECTLQWKIISFRGMMWPLTS
jgi:hypothetical protein